VKMSGGKCPTFDPIMAASDPAHLPVYLHAVVLRLRVKSAIRRLADFFTRKSSAPQNFTSKTTPLSFALSSPAARPPSCVLFLLHAEENLFTGRRQWRSQKFSTGVRQSVAFVFVHSRSAALPSWST